MDHQQQLQGMFAGMGTKELAAMIVVTAAEYAARLRSHLPLREGPGLDAGFEVLVTLEPPGVHLLLIDSNGTRRMVAVGSPQGAGH
jgi:hypothetical protein